MSQIYKILKPKYILKLNILPTRYSKTVFLDRVTLLFRQENPLPSVVADHSAARKLCHFLESLHTTCGSYNFTLRVQLCKFQRGSLVDFSFAEPEISPSVDGCL